MNKKPMYPVNHSATKTNSKENIMLKLQKIAPCLWFDNQAEEAAKFYTGIFEN